MFPLTTCPDVSDAAEVVPQDKIPVPSALRKYPDVIAPAPK